MGDLEDLIPKYDPAAERLPSCNAVIKLTEDGRILIAHNTFNIYSLMLRVYKTYDFALHDTHVKANLSFSSRPGDLNSKDDFYMLRESSMVVVETSLNNYNQSNYDFIQPYSLPTVLLMHYAVDPCECSFSPGRHPIAVGTILRLQPKWISQQPMARRQA